MKKILFFLLIMSVLPVMAKKRMETLPALKFSDKPVVVVGKVNNYQASKHDPILFSFAPLLNSERYEVEAEVKADGQFSVELPLHYSDVVSMVFNNKVYQLAVVPGEENGITINAELPQNSKTPQFVFSGTMADFNNDLFNYGELYAQSKILEPISTEEGIKTLKGLTVEQYRDRIIQLYDDAAAKLKKDKRLCGAFKEYVDATYMYQAFIKIYLYRGTMNVANGNNDEIVLPEGFFNFLNDWNPFSKKGIYYMAPAMRMASNAASYGRYTLQHPLAVHSDYAELAAACPYLNTLAEMVPLSEEQLAKMDNEVPHFKAEIRQQNDALVARLEAAKNNPDIRVKEISAELTGEDIFKAIVADYKGKPVLVDFWATWCGPCKAAMKTILPVKEELWGKANFVYVTGPTSPEAVWKSNIIDIHGDHYYVTNEQWTALLKQFETQGIPTYVIVDRDGNVKAKHIGYPGNDVMMNELK